MNCLGRNVSFAIAVLIGIAVQNGTPVIALASTPWHLDRLDQHTGLDFAPFDGQVTARARPVLYVIDSGINMEHQEFSAGLSTVTLGYNFADESWDSTDCMGHGTHVAGLAVGKEYGVAGSIGVDVVSVRILDCHGRGTCSSLIRALEWVHRNHSALRPSIPGVVVMSIGSRQSECQGVDIVADSLSDQNILVVAAAGNSASDACMYHPASSPNAITVAAMHVEGSRDVAWQKTNFGDCVDLFAPGVAVESAWPGSEYRNNTRVLSGTSMAAPLVAGQALLILAAVPGASVPVIRKIIQGSASRGTIFGTQVDPGALGSRVARVPWLGVDSRRVASYSDGRTKPPVSGGSGDVVSFAVGTSRTEPAMQYGVDHIAYLTFAKLLESHDVLREAGLLVSCSHEEVPAEEIVPFLRKGAALSWGKKSWSERRTRAEVELPSFHVACNVTVSAGMGRDLTSIISGLLSKGRLRGMFEEEVLMLSEPVLTGPGAVSSTGSSSWMKAVIITGCLIAFAVLVGVLFWWSRYRWWQWRLGGTRIYRVSSSPTFDCQG